MTWGGGKEDTSYFWNSLPLRVSMAYGKSARTRSSLEFSLTRFGCKWHCGGGGVFCTYLFLSMVCGMNVVITTGYPLWSPILYGALTLSCWVWNFTCFMSDPHYCLWKTFFHPFYRMRELTSKFHTAINRQTVDLNPLTLSDPCLLCYIGGHAAFFKFQPVSWTCHLTIISTRFLICKVEVWK